MNKVGVLLFHFMYVSRDYDAIVAHKLLSQVIYASISARLKSTKYSGFQVDSEWDFTSENICNRDDLKLFAKTHTFMELIPQIIMNNSTTGPYHTIQCFGKLNITPEQNKKNTKKNI